MRSLAYPSSWIVAAIFFFYHLVIDTAAYSVDREVDCYGVLRDFDTAAAGGSSSDVSDEELYVMEWPSVTAGTQISCFIERCTPQVKTGYAFVQGVVNNGTGITTTPTEGVAFESNLGCPPDLIMTAETSGIFYSAFYCQDGCQNMTVTCNNADDCTFATAVTNKIKHVWNHYGGWRHLFASEESVVDDQSLVREEKQARGEDITDVIDPVLLEELEGKPRLLVDRLLAEEEEETQPEEEEPAPLKFDVDAGFACYGSFGEFETPPDADGINDNALGQSQLFVTEWPSVSAGTTFTCDITCDTNTSYAFAQGIHAPNETVSEFLFEDRTVGSIFESTNGCPLSVDMRADTDGPLFVAVFCRDGCTNGLITCQSHGPGADCDFVSTRIKSLWNKGWSALTGGREEGPTRGRRRLRRGVKDISTDYDTRQPQAMTLTQFLLAFLAPQGAMSSSLRGLEGTEEFASGSYPSLGRKSCRGNSDCPQVNCFAAPCDVNYCNTNGYCSMQSLVENTNEEMIGTPFGSDYGDASDYGDLTESTATAPPFFEDGDESTQNSEEMIDTPFGSDSDYGDLTESTATAPPFLEDGDESTQNSTGTPCGKATCTGSQVCCNESCGECAEPGGICSDELCVTDDETVDNDGAGEECGPNVCSVGETCCNKSCGYCVLPGGGCTKEFCGVIKQEDGEFDDGDGTKEGEEGADDGGWVMRGTCETCEGKCSVCQQFFGYCIQLRCDEDA